MRWDRDGPKAPEASRCNNFQRFPNSVLAMIYFIRSTGRITFIKVIYKKPLQLKIVF